MKVNTPNNLFSYEEEHIRKIYNKGNHEKIQTNNNFMVGPCKAHGIRGHETKIK